MKEIVLDITRLLDRFMQGRLATGVDRVNLEYVRYFKDRATGLVRFGGRWLELDRTNSLRIFEALLDRPAHFNALVRWVVGRSYALHLRSMPGKGRFFLNAGHSGLDLPEYGRRLSANDWIPLFFVHDLIPITHPEYCRPGEAPKHVARMNTVLDVGRGVICNSGSTLDDLRAFAVRAGRVMPESVAALLAPAVFPAVDPPPLMTEPYYVVLGTIEPRKNHWLLLHVWRQLAMRLGPRTPKLVVIGQRGWECENVVDMLERCEVLHGHVVERSACSDDELSSLLHHARALLFPSFTEGYGMPLVEALSLGTPVIASDLPVFREIAGEIPDYLDPLDGLGWMNKVESYAVSGSPERERQLRRLEGFVPPDWRGHFEQVEAMMARVGR